MFYIYISGEATDLILQKYFGMLKFCVARLQKRSGYVYNDSVLSFWVKLGLRLVLGLMKNPRFQGTFVGEAIIGLVSLVEVILHHALSLVLNAVLAKCKL